MSFVKHDMQISDNALRDRIIEYMIAHNLTPHTFANHCGIKSGKTITCFIAGDNMRFMSRVKIIAGLKK